MLWDFPGTKERKMNGKVAVMEEHTNTGLITRWTVSITHPRPLPFKCSED